MTSANAAASNDATPTLELRQFALRSSGAAWHAPLDLHSDARRVALVGDWSPLSELLAARTDVASGTISLLGHPLESAISRGILGFAACDPALPGSFTVSEYLRHAARLSHGSASRAVHDERRALERYGLTELAKRKLSELALYQKRALGIAQATLTSPPVVYLETPLRGLDAPSAEYVSRLCMEAAAHGRLLLSAELPSSPSPERTLLDACEELFVLTGGSIVAHGAPSAVFAVGARYSMLVRGENLANFASTLRTHGVQLEVGTELGRFNIELSNSAGSTTDLLLDTALDHGLTVLELEPLLNM